MGLKQTKLNRKMMDFAAINQGKDNLTTPEEMIFCLKLMNEFNETIWNRWTKYCERYIETSAMQRKAPSTG